MDTILRKDFWLPFSRESWCDRMVASRGVGATLADEAVSKFRVDLMEVLSNEETNFSVLHEGVIIKLKRN